MVGVDIEIHCVEDRKGLYVDSILVSEGKGDVFSEYLLKHCPILIDSLYTKYHDDDSKIAVWCRNECGFPSNLHFLRDIE